MNPQRRSIRVLCRCVLVVAALSCEATPLLAAAEFHGLWVDGFGPGFFNLEQIKKLAADCRKYNFNAVFVEMRRRGDALYLPEAPNEDPRTTILEPGFDALAAIIRECHQGTPRIEVHCWVVGHFIWAWHRPPDQPGHVFNKHPEYLTRDSLGEKLIAKGYYLDPGNPEANQTIYNMAIDIVRRYDIDGLHWDYVRYPTQDSGYNQTAIRRFNQEFGLSGEPLPDDPRFSDWRRRQVTDFLKWVNADLWELKPNLAISISVFASYNDARNYRFSDWADWTRDGIVDYCLPMDFSADAKNIYMPRVDLARTNVGARHVYIGQGAYLNSKESTLAQLNYAREKGFPGTCVYSYRSCDSVNTNQESTFTYLRDQFQPQWSATPVLPWKTQRGIVKGTVRHGRAAEPVYNATITLDREPLHSTRTEPHGKYAFFDVVPGDWKVTASSPGAVPETRTLRVKAGEVLTVDFNLAYE